MSDIKLEVMRARGAGGQVDTIINDLTHHLNDIPSSTSTKPNLPYVSRTYLLESQSPCKTNGANIRLVQILRWRLPFADQVFEYYRTGVVHSKSCVPASSTANSRERWRNVVIPEEILYEVLTVVKKSEHTISHRCVDTIPLFTLFISQPSH